MKQLPDIDKHGSVTEALEKDQLLMVQIVKEPISSKGPRLTTEITFTGRFLVLIPFSDKISVSQKNQDYRGKSAPATARREHSPEKLRNHRTHIG
jgi:Rne/Rng family ribonuclease